MRRRDFLKTVPLGVAATAIPIMIGARRAEAITHSPMLSALTNANAEDDHVLVILFMEGGNDGLNTIIPFEDPLYDHYRKNLGFTTPEEKARLTFKLRPDIGVSPYAAALEPLWQEGKLAVVQNLGIKNPDLSHFRGLEIWNSASDDDLLIPTGWMGRYLESVYPSYPDVLPQDPIAINMGTLGSQIFRGSRSMMDVQVPDPLNFTAAAQNGSNTLPLTEGGIELGFVRDLVGISNTYSQRFGQLFPKYAVSDSTYPPTQIASDLQHIAWCIAAGLKTKVYFASLRGFDTHFYQESKDDSNGQGHAFLLRQFCEALYAFQRDLEGLGIADRVVTMTYSEFGRRVNENGDWASGTDHGTSAPHFVVGTSVNGELYGHHPDLANLDSAGDMINEFEFRQYYASALADWFGVDETLRTSILSPGRDHDPFDINFAVNGASRAQHLIRRATTGVRSDNVPDAMAATLMPNPASRECWVRFVSDGRDGQVLTDLFDARGTHLLALNQASVRGENRIMIETASIPSGTYYVKLRTSARTQTLKLQIVR